MRKGFTLIEVMVAIFLITVGAGGAFVLIQRTIAFTSVISSQLTAAYLAQEGIEIVRNIRDTNWLEKRANPGISWDEGISSSGLEVVNFLDGTQSKFQRKITIIPGVDLLEIQVEVSWQERGRDHRVTAQTELHNWR